MSRWESLYVIGLTGNIATGKSMVRRMLADLGAVTIDADELAHETLYKGGPAYAGVVQAFGPGILRESGEIDRARLGAIVFRDPQQLARLEAVIHPAVLAIFETRMQALARPDLPGEWLSHGRQAAHKDGKVVVVVEAIKLIESGMADWCDQIWATSAPIEHQIERLKRFRRLSDNEAHARVDAQGLQLGKLARADVVFDNAGSIEELRSQVVRAWQRLLHGDPAKARADSAGSSR